MRRISYHSDQRFLIAALRLGGRSRSSQPEVFYKKDVLKILQNLLENNWDGVSFLIKLQVKGLNLY